MTKELILDVVIEIPKDSKVKYEYDRTTKQIKVDRILYGSNIYPQNYGFIPGALDWDGDELDVLVYAQQSFNPGTIVPTRIIGALEMIDDGETDTKLIGIIAVDPRFKDKKTLQDLPEHSLKEIKNFFETYKLLQNKKVIVKQFKDTAWAIKEYQECVTLMQKYGKLPKEQFIQKMKNEHPQKYEVK
ncbi:MAG: inorganic diphosphatase [Mycoplasmataceae bacterium]|nr:inorganic diphosphatase [Mycoplasmataceae bacterium]